MAWSAPFSRVSSDGEDNGSNCGMQWSIESARWRDNVFQLAVIMPGPLLVASRGKGAVVLSLARKECFIMEDDRKPLSRVKMCYGMESTDENTANYD
nr:unnamed protein product [Haemonchus contortus]